MTGAQQMRKDSAEVEGFAACMDRIAGTGGGYSWCTGAVMHAHAGVDDCSAADEETKVAEVEGLQHA
jgi:hypothetical protein